MTLSIAVILYLIFCLLAGALQAVTAAWVFRHLLIVAFLTPVLVLLAADIDRTITHAERRSLPQSN
mgnify:CR=1 FL=1